MPLSVGHLIPDEVARTHPLAQAARARGVPPWDLDNPENGIALPGSPEKVGTTGSQCIGGRIGGTPTMR